MERKELPEKAAARMKWITARLDASAGETSEIHRRRDEAQREIDALEDHKRRVRTQTYGAKEQDKEIELDDSEISKIKRRLAGLNADYLANAERRKHFIALRERLEAYLKENNYLLPGEQNPRPTFGWTEHTTAVEFPSQSPEQLRQQRLAARGWRQ